MACCRFLNLRWCTNSVFKCSPKTFHWRITISVPLATHGSDHAKLLLFLVIVRTGIGWIQPVVVTHLIMEVYMGRPAGRMRILTKRGVIRSPGALLLRNEIERLFWEQIATGITSEKAAEAGLS